MKKIKFNKKIKSLIYVIVLASLLNCLINFFINKPIFSSLHTLFGVILGLHVFWWNKEDEE